MRYAFLMKEEFQLMPEKVSKKKKKSQSGGPEVNYYVGKVPKDMHPKTYNLDSMKSDIEAMFICSHIVKEFNERLISSIDSKYLVEFVHSFIYEILDDSAPYKYLYGENFIQGKYQKYNNNAGWADVGNQSGPSLHKDHQ